MNILKHTFPVSKTARYYTIGELNDKTRFTWIVCHGYGQLAGSFIKKFESLVDDENYVIAPEGLHRYYLDEKHTRVGASWMTREDRLDDINDYIRLMDELFHLELNNFKGKIILLGFSQGVATAARWYRLGNVQPDVFVMWAGVFPPDLPMENELTDFNTSSNYVVIGNEDEYFNSERKKLILEEISKKGIKFDMITFNGKHVIDKPILTELKNRISQLSL